MIDYAIIGSIKRKKWKLVNDQIGMRDSRH